MAKIQRSMRVYLRRWCSHVCNGTGTFSKSKTMGNNGLFLLPYLLKNYWAQQTTFGAMKKE